MAQNIDGIFGLKLKLNWVETCLGLRISKELTPKSVLFEIHADRWLALLRGWVLLKCWVDGRRCKSPSHSKAKLTMIESVVDSYRKFPQSGHRLISVDYATPDWERGAFSPLRPPRIPIPLCRQRRWLAHCYSWIFRVLSHRLSYVCSLGCEPL